MKDDSTGKRPKAPPELWERFKKLEGTVMSGEFRAKQRLEPRPGQIWTLKPGPDGSAPMVCLFMVDDALNFCTAMKVADGDAVRMATDRDFCLIAKDLDPEHPIMIETWNVARFPLSMLSCCITAPSGLTIHSMVLLRAVTQGEKNPTIPPDIIGSVGPPIRWPGDPRIEFQQAEAAVMAAVDRAPVSFEPKRAKSSRPADAQRPLALAAATGAEATPLMSDEEIDAMFHRPGVVGMLTMEGRTALHVQMLIHEQDARDSTMWGQTAQKGLNAALSAARDILKKSGKTPEGETHRDFYTHPLDGKPDVPVSVEGASMSLAAGLAILSTARRAPLPWVFAVGTITPQGRVGKVDVSRLALKIIHLVQSPLKSKIAVLLLPKDQEAELTAELARDTSIDFPIRWVSALDDAWQAALARVPRAKPESKPPTHPAGPHLTPLQKEHYMVAEELSRQKGGTPFTRKEFIALYYEMYPNRAPGSILPADFVLKETGDPDRPRFLQSAARASFEFLGDIRLPGDPVNVPEGQTLITDLKTAARRLEELGLCKAFSPAGKINVRNCRRFGHLKAGQWYWIDEELVAKRG